MCNVISFEGKGFCEFFYMSWLLMLLCCLNVALHFRQIVSRLTSLCETNRAAVSSPLPTKTMQLGVVLQTSEALKCALFFYSPGANKCFASACCGKQRLWCLSTKTGCLRTCFNHSCRSISVDLQGCYEIQQTSVLPFLPASPK